MPTSLVRSSLTKNDFFNPLFSRSPIFVAFVIWLTGWGSLLLLAWRTDSLFGFFRNPKFMISDFLLLPACGFLVACFYRSVRRPAGVATSKRVNYGSMGLATLATILATGYSIFISNNYGGVWSVPHTLFIWFMAYILIGFFATGVLQLRVRSRPSLWFHHIGVALALVGHAIFGLLWG